MRHRYIYKFIWWPHGRRADRLRLREKKKKRKTVSDTVLQLAVFLTQKRDEIKIATTKKKRKRITSESRWQRVTAKFCTILITARFSVGLRKERMYKFCHFFPRFALVDFCGGFRFCFWRRLLFFSPNYSALLCDWAAVFEFHRITVMSSASQDIAEQWTHNGATYALAFVDLWKANMRGEKCI